MGCFDFKQLNHTELDTRLLPESNRTEWKQSTNPFSKAFNNNKSNMSSNETTEQQLIRFGSYFMPIVSIPIPHPSITWSPYGRLLCTSGIDINPE